MARPPKKFYADQSRNGTEDEITIYTPDGRAMLCVGFWDAEHDDDPSKHNADQIKADATLIVEALNSHRKAARWFRALNAAEVYLRLLALKPGASPELKKIHKKLLNAVCG